MMLGAAEYRRVHEPSRALDCQQQKFHLDSYVRGWIGKGRDIDAARLASDRS